MIQREKKKKLCALEKKLLVFISMQGHRSEVIGRKVLNRMVISAEM